MYITINGQRTGYKVDETCIKETLQFDKDLLARVVEVEEGVSLKDEAFDLIREAIINDGWCGEYSAQLICPNTDEVLFDGLIRVLDSGLELNQCRVDVSLINNDSFYKLTNNKKTDVVVPQGSSISGNVINEITPYYINMAGCGGDVEIEAYRYSDVLSHIVEWATDGVTTLCSPTIDLLDTLFITNGSRLRQGELIDDLQVSLNDLISEINKITPIRNQIETNCFSVQNYDDFFTSANYTIQNENTDLKLSNVKAFKEQMYSSLKIGSSTYTKQGDQTEDECATPNISLAHTASHALDTWEKFDTPNTNNCSDDKVLDLINDWIIDNNTIQDVAENLNRDYDDDIFLLHCKNVNETNFTADIETATDGANEYYNYTLQNGEKLSRYETYLQNSGVCWANTSPVATAELALNENSPPLSIWNWRIENSQYSMFGAYDVKPDGFNNIINYTNTLGTIFSQGGYPQNTVSSAPFQKTHAIAYTPEITGLYELLLNINLSANGIFASPDHSFEWRVFEHGVAWQLGSPLSNYLFIEEFVYPSSTSTQGYNLKIRKPVQLTAGVTYIIDMVYVLGQPHAFAGSIDKDSLLHVFFKGNNPDDCIGLENRNIKVDVDGVICKEDWSQIKENGSLRLPVKSDCFTDLDFWHTKIKRNICTGISEIEGFTVGI